MASAEKLLQVLVLYFISQKKGKSAMIKLLATAAPTLISGAAAIVYNS